MTNKGYNLTYDDFQLVTKHDINLCFSKLACELHRKPNSELSNDARNIKAFLRYLSFFSFYYSFSLRFGGWVS